MSLTFLVTILVKEPQTHLLGINMNYLISSLTDNDNEQTVLLLSLLFRQEIQTHSEYEIYQILLIQKYGTYV